MPLRIGAILFCAALGWLAVGEVVLGASGIRPCRWLRLLGGELGLRRRLRLAFGVVSVGALTVAGSLVAGPPASASYGSSSGRPLCDQNSVTCAETAFPYNYAGYYTGHDEPSLLFYSGVAGSGNNQVYRITLPKDPPIQPVQDGSGGTFNFQLHPAFWFGMTMCDDQSAPNPGGSALAGSQIPCTPDSDSNIYDGTQVSDSNYIGKHPGVAFMEMQFYPPSWVKWPPGNSCDAKMWCAALNIDSFNSNQNTGVTNNATCLTSVGIEPVNFAFITKSGAAQAPANPVDATLATYTPDASKDLFMRSGDTLAVSMFDTAAGFEVVIDDLTSGQSGSMTASTANGFGHVVYAPNASTCTTDGQAFHPAYSTSSEHTRVPWAAHSYNIAFSDEIGHFEYCNGVSPRSGQCYASGVNDPNGLDGDENGCFSPSQSSLIRVGGCLGTEVDFDGVPYQNTWPGTNPNHATDAAYHPTPILFTSPLANGTTAYDRVAFETDLPRIEINSLSPNNHCNRTTGVGCVNPPNGAAFYPFYSYATSGGGCRWQLGGQYIPDSNYSIGTDSTTVFGPLLFLTYPTPKGANTRTNDFRNVLNSNPC
jgi:hypothetical protein